MPDRRELLKGFQRILEKKTAPSQTEAITMQLFEIRDILSLLAEAEFQENVEALVGRMIRLLEKILPKVSRELHSQMVLIEDVERYINKALLVYRDETSFVRQALLHSEGLILDFLDVTEGFIPIESKPYAEDAFEAWIQKMTEYVNADWDKLELSEIEVWSQCLDLDLAKMKNILNLDIAKRKKLLALYRSISENTSKYSDRKFHTLLIAMKYSFERYLFSK